MTVAALVLPPLSLIPYLTAGTELVRLRNALVFDASPAPAFEWTPDSAPADFLRERALPNPLFVNVVQRLRLHELSDDWARALAISRHLLGSAPRLHGGAIQADLQTTYRRITVQGDGYCADFVRAFQAIATAAGMPMRAWAFSFDGYGGDGHVLPEIWNRQRQVWQVLDVFNNVYFVDGQANQPLSASELRAALRQRSPALGSVKLDPSARLGFRYDEKLWAYYRRGLDEWYLWWGNNPFDQENAALVRGLTPLSRSLAQLGAIAQGVQPRAHALATGENAPQRQAMQRLRWHLVLAAGVCAIGLILLLWLLWRRIGSARASEPSGMRHAR
jgi:hypothetical protein